MDLRYKDDELLTAKQLRVIIDDYLRMTRKELADRMGISESHVFKVARGTRPATKSFARKVWQLVRSFENGTLKDYVPRPEKPKVGSSHVGSGANLPEDYEPAPASVATTATRGSKAKVEVLRLRAERGENLWHDSDNKFMRRHEEE